MYLESHLPRPAAASLVVGSTSTSIPVPVPVPVPHTVHTEVVCEAWEVLAAAIRHPEGERGQCRENAGFCRGLESCCEACMGQLTWPLYCSMYVHMYVCSTVLVHRGRRGTEVGMPSASCGFRSLFPSSRRVPCRFCPSGGTAQRACPPRSPTRQVILSTLSSCAQRSSTMDATSISGPGSLSCPTCPTCPTSPARLLGVNRMYHSLWYPFAVGLERGRTVRPWRRHGIHVT